MNLYQIRAVAKCLYIPTAARRKPELQQTICKKIRAFEECEKDNEIGWRIYTDPNRYFGFVRKTDPNSQKWIDLFEQAEEIFIQQYRLVTYFSDLFYFVQGNSQFSKKLVEVVRCYAEILHVDGQLKFRIGDHYDQMRKFLFIEIGNTGEVFIIAPNDSTDDWMINMYTEQQMLIIGKYAILHGYESTEKIFHVSHATIAKAAKLVDSTDPQFRLDRKKKEEANQNE